MCFEHVLHIFTQVVCAFVCMSLTCQVFVPDVLHAQALLHDLYILSGFFAFHALYGALVVHNEVSSNKIACQPNRLVVFSHTFHIIVFDLDIFYSDALLCATIIQQDDPTISIFLNQQFSILLCANPLASFYFSVFWRHPGRRNKIDMNIIYLTHRNLLAVDRLIH